MIKYRVQLRSVQNVAASKTALIDIPCGPRYHYIVLEHGYSAGTNTIAAACTNISEIRIYSNSRIQRVMSGTQLRDMNILNGTAFDCTGVPNTAPGVTVPIFLGEPWRETPADQDALGWATAGWLSFQIQVDFGAASTPTLLAYAVTDDFVPAANTNPGIVKWIRTQLVPGGTQYDYNALDRRDFLFRRRDRFIECLASLTGFPTLLQVHQLFDHVDIGAGRNRAVQHVHRRHRNQRGQFVLRNDIDLL